MAKNFKVQLFQTSEGEWAYRVVNVHGQRILESLRSYSTKQAAMNSLSGFIVAVSENRVKFELNYQEKVINESKTPQKTEGTGWDPERAAQ